MIFKVGIGWDDGGQWRFISLTATAENHEQELDLFGRFSSFLDEHTGGAFTDPQETALYHWTSAEVSWLGRACERHNFSADHPLRTLPWCDLQKTLLSGPAGIPAALGYGLKEVATALGHHEAEYRVEWPGDLDKALRAMVMGWRVYEAERPQETTEMMTVAEYLETDCKALWSILRWLRAGVSSSAR